MKRLSLLISLFIISICAFAQSVCVEGIYYKLDSDAKTASVTCTANAEYSDGVVYNNSYSGKVKIPKSIKHEGEKYRVTSIGLDAFQNCHDLISVNIPSSVTRIEEQAFFRCYGITSIDIPNSVTSIGGLAFYHCDNLSSIEIPNSVESIGFEAFRDCEKLTTVEIGKSVLYIGPKAFLDTPLKSIVVNKKNPYLASKDNIIFDNNRSIV